MAINYGLSDCIVENSGYLYSMKEIPGHAGYWVTEDGRVFSDCGTGCKPRCSPELRHELRPIKAQAGHPVVRLGRASGRPLFVHRLVLLTYVGPCPQGLEVRHLDGVPSNNRLENLAYGTRAENIEDARRHGTLACGDKHWHRKLTSERVREARQLYANGIRGTEIARRMGVHFVTMYDALNRKTWSHLT